MRLLLSFIGCISSIIPSAAVSFIGGFPMDQHHLDLFKGRPPHRRHK